MILNVDKLSLVTVVLLVFISCFANVWAEEPEENITANNEEKIVPETLAVEVQGHENTSARKARQFGFPPPSPFGFGGYRPFPPSPGFYGPVGGGGFAGGGFQRTRVVTRTQYRVVDRYRGGGFRGGFYG